MFAAAGIIVPVIIHFWNRKQGKTLKVGSISLLAESYKQQAKSLQLQERLLLLLRCLLLLLIAFLLAQPFWKEQPGASKQQGWILMEKQGLLQTYNQFKPVIDSLTAKQYEFHYFDEGFEKEELKNVLTGNKDSLAKNNHSYWSLITSLDQEVPASLPVFLFTANSLTRFSGSRPQVAMNLQWYTYTAADSVSEWLAKAYITTADSIRLVAASSQPSGTSYFFKNAPVASQKTEEYNIQAGNNNISVSYQSKQPVTVDTNTLTVTIFTDKYANDAAYVKAALQAIQQYSRRKIKLSLVRNVADIPHHQDWVFWLSDQAISGITAGNIFTYEKGKGEVLGSSIQSDNNESEEAQVALYKRIPYKATSAAASKTVWQDGFGNPLLEVDKTRVPVYHFYSRFDPSWSGLPWSHAFPQMLFNVIWNPDNNISLTDKRVMDAPQFQPVFTTQHKAAVKEKFARTHDLSQAFWIAALIVFLVERYISFKIKMEKTDA